MTIDWVQGNNHIVITPKFEYIGPNNRRDSHRKGFK